jgi:hypothetical protein
LKTFKGMSRIIKKISVFFLWLAWLVLTAHMIIPHDHHLADSVTGQGDSCPLSPDKSERHSGFPPHCHAFNDLTSEKATAFLMQDQVHHNDLFFSDFTDIFVFELSTSPVTIFDIRKSFPDSNLLELSLLRAPPCLS